MRCRSVPHSLRLTNELGERADASATAATYNAGIGRLTAIEDHSGTTQLRYDDRGNLIEDQRSATLASGTYTHKLQYRYDLANQLTAIVYPDGSEVTYTYNALGEVTDIQADIAGNWLDTTLADNIRYQPFGPVQQLTWGNGLTLSRSFDQDGRIRRQRIPGIQDLDYGFDANSNITGIIDGIDPAHSVAYDYDALNRLTADISGKAEHRFRYDAIGNRLEKTATAISAGTGTGTDEGSGTDAGTDTGTGTGNDTNAGTTQTENYHYASDSNRLATRNGTNYQYDAAGNTVNDGAHRYQYDASNRMHSAQTASGAPLAHYRYNALGQRTSKTLTHNGHTTVFAYGPAGKLLSEATLDASGNVIDRKHYVWLATQPIAQLQPSADDSDYQVLYLHADHLNTPRKATNADQTIVWQWQGEAFGATEANDDPDGDTIAASINLRFPGQYFDAETNKHYNYFRDYDPGLGRYIQSDPIGLGGGINTYVYVRAQPINRIDPYGKISILVPAFIVGAGLFLASETLENVAGPALEERRREAEDAAMGVAGARERLEQANRRVDSAVRAAGAAGALSAPPSGTARGNASEISKAVGEAVGAAIGGGGSVGTVPPEIQKEFCRQNPSAPQCKPDCK